MFTNRFLFDLLHGINQNSLHPFLQDARNKIVNEVLQGIRVIKFFAW